MNDHVQGCRCERCMESPGGAETLWGLLFVVCFAGAIGGWLWQQLPWN